MPKIFFVLMLIALVGCSQRSLISETSTQPPARATIITTNPSDSATIAPTLVPLENAGDWQTLTTGIEQQVLVPFNQALASMITLRLDPTQVTFRVHYTPSSPRNTAQWREALPDALVIINANFFHPDYSVLGMLISDGVTYGQSFGDRGGTFFVDGESVGVRSNVYEPYQGESYQQAIQAFPMLVYGGAQAYTNSRDLRGSRRTVIGMDAEGRVIVMATPGIGLGLYDLSAWLPTTDLGLVNAFNLDGGGSTMMVIAPANYAVNAFDAVPSVLAIYAK
jgi:exopolysaccharide biosynthesis protein